MNISDFKRNIEDFKKSKLKITYKKDLGKIIIVGNKEGLEYLADCCLRIIGKTDSAGHFHLEWQMGNLIEGSTETILEFSENPEDNKT